MTKGRKIGQTEIGIDDMVLINELTIKGVSRYQIAKQLGRSPTTIYYHQKKLNLI